MNSKDLLKLILIGACMTGFVSAHAQTSASDQTDAWTVVEEQWDAQEDGEDEWADTLLTDDFTGWVKDSPAPRSKSSLKLWNRVDEMLGKMVAHELYPLSIVVNGDVAIAHYLYRGAFQTTDGTVKMRNGRYTDVLVRTDDGWKFLAWHGGAD